jgi:tRNA pseudouridine55 synthase
MGHGGTLDPMATGVLIIGVGAGTKRLADFLLCKKTYDTTVLFGKSSDTYDIAGKNVAEAPYQHITREFVEEKLRQFRGKIKQVPPIYSALKIDGMKAYEYARSGKELPRELESREMEVTECELLEFHEGGDHDFRWPAAEAGEEEKKAAKKFLGEPEEPVSTKTEDRVPISPDTKLSSDVKKGDADEHDPSALPEPPAPIVRKAAFNNRLSPQAKAALHTHHIPILSSKPSPAPAARIRLTVSSGFYVRSFAHDLGRAVGSMGMMASLVRSRQADFSCEPDETDAIQTLTYGELEEGEAIWGPRVESMLEDWTKKQARQREREDLSGFTPRRNEGAGYYERNRDAGQRREGRGDRRRHDSGSRGGRDFGDKRRRNSSSPE